jgi:membrane dipeptidase
MGALTGGALDAWTMAPGWKRGGSMLKEMNYHLEGIITRMNYICQIAGNTRHIGIGSDLDGAFGKE